MFIRLLAVFILLPLVELALLIQVGRWIGVFWTVVLVFATGLLGAALARRQGVQAWTAIQQELGQGQMPTRALVDGLLILVGAVVLLTPGILTDIFGFLMLAPVTRGAFRRYLGRRLERAAQRGETRISVLLLP